MGPGLILPGFVVPSRINQVWDQSGIDSLEHCTSKTDYLKYPHQIEYKYNDRGYRDNNWPANTADLESFIWCFGDSFTVGIGSPYQHTWPYLLSNRLDIRTVNISLDGASNLWIVRKILHLLEYLAPPVLVIHWSYIHRRESSAVDAVDLYWRSFYQKIKDSCWPDCNTLKEFINLPQIIKQEILEQHQLDPAIIEIVKDFKNLENYCDELRRVWSDFSDDVGDYQNIKYCIDTVTSATADRATVVIHSFIPNFANPGVSDSIVDYLKSKKLKYVPPFRALDLARDGHHYDIKTAEFLVNSIVDQLG
jgi:hypothetical protein